MTYELPKLPYAMDALEPYLSKETLDYHYSKHHATYVNNLNKLVPGSAYDGFSLEELVMKAEGGIFNNAAQVWNHTFYWNCLCPNGGGEPSGALADAINDAFGSFAEFKTAFSASATTLFGSGWAWLVKNPSGKLEIIQESNAGNPMTKGYVPLLTFDVWEHAYYVDKRNRRPAYIEDLWNLVDWKAVAARL